MAYSMTQEATNTRRRWGCACGCLVVIGSILLALAILLIISLKSTPPVTREQMAIMIVKAAKLQQASGQLSFADSGKVSVWAYSWVMSAVNNQLMSGYEDNTFRPQNNATRAEAVTVIYNALN